MYFYILLCFLSHLNLDSNCNDYIIIRAYHYIQDINFDYKVIISNRDVTVKDSCMKFHEEDLCIATHIFVVNDSIFSELNKFIADKNTGTTKLPPYNDRKITNPIYSVSAIKNGKYKLQYYIDGTKEVNGFFSAFSKQLKLFNIEYHYNEKYY